MLAFPGRLIAIVFASCWARCAAACPWCESSTATRVRDGIFDSDFAVNALQMALPLLILSLLVAAFYFWPTQLGTAYHVRSR